MKLEDGLGMMGYAKPSKVLRFLADHFPTVINSSADCVFRSVYTDVDKDVDKMSAIDVERIIERGKASQTLLSGDVYSENAWRKLESALPDFLASTEEENQMLIRATVINTMKYVREMLIINAWFGQQAESVQLNKAINAMEEKKNG